MPWSCQELEKVAPAVPWSCQDSGQELEKAAPAVLRSCQRSKKLLRQCLEAAEGRKSYSGSASEVPRPQNDVSQAVEATQRSKDKTQDKTQDKILMANRRLTAQVAQLKGRYMI